MTQYVFPLRSTVDQLIAAAKAFGVQRSNHTGTQPAATITGLASVATSGVYTDLTGKPTIPSTPSAVGAEPAGLSTATIASLAAPSSSTQTGSYVLAASDVGKVVEITAASDTFVSIPTDGTAPLPIGTELTISRLGVGNVRVVPQKSNKWPNPSSETTLNSTNRNGSVALSVSAAQYGNQGVIATSTAITQNFGVFLTTSLASTGFSAGDVISVSLWLSSPDNLTSYLGIRFNRDSTTIASYDSSASPTSAAGARATVNAVTIPAGTNQIVVFTQSTSTAVGQRQYSDGIMLVPGTVSPATYFDGNSIEGQWSGVVNSSTSAAPVVNTIDPRIAQYGRVKVRKIAANTWVMENALAPAALVAGAGTTSDRDNGQQGITFPTTSQGTIGTGGLVANRTVMMRGVPSRDMTITKIAFRVTVADAANNSIDLGVYDSSGILVAASTGATAGLLNSTGTKVVTLTTPVPLTAGNTYYAALSTNSTATLSTIVTLGDVYGTFSPYAEVLTKDSAYPLSTTITGTAAASTAFALVLRES